MNSDIVKPAPVNRLPAAKRGQLNPKVRVARPRRTASQAKANTPIGLPSTSAEEAAEGPGAPVGHLQWKARAVLGHCEASWI